MARGISTGEGMQVMMIINPITILEDNVIVPVAVYGGLSEDRIRYVFLLFVAVFLGFCMKYVLHPSRASATTRHCYSFVCGLTFGLMCFGIVQMIYLFFAIGICYLFLLTLPTKVIHIYTMVWMLTCISTAHIYRLITDYGGYHLDFTGPLMVIVQRTTYVAFALHDGTAREAAQLNEDQKKQQLKQRPSLLEYLSYNFCFLCFLAGPLCTYKEYQDFITGSNFTSAKLENPNRFALAKEHIGEPSNMIIALLKTLGAILFLSTYITLDTWFPLKTIFVPEMNMFKRLVIVCVIAFAMRTKYYYIWLMAESACNAAGLGFSGYNKLGHPQWDLVSSVDISAIELGTSVRTRVNGWNINTSKWLRRVCYERVKFVDPLLASFVLSAWWHGFYPGYYIFFVTLALYIMAGRKMRRLLRHRFQSHLATKWCYDILTWSVSFVWLCAIAMTMEILHLEQSIQCLSYFYFFPVVTPLVVMMLPVGQKTRQQEGGTKVKQTEVVSNKIE